ncbi:type I pullulanase [Aerococcus sp. UMB7834]|uniref:type I pullulanase n=2 Tax=Lactobacillales TaxID=186826 RepID=UPI00254F7B87|nr:type I pullulanase [Aerococcus sp. UMB7834]MDK6805956.1 type I pullulanase [Aerococcus sp. UMB7834]
MELLDDLFALSGIESPQTIREAMHDYALSEEFDQTYAYGGALGAVYHKRFTRFVLWAPLAQQVDLLVFKDLYSELYDSYPMKRQKKGTYEASIAGDCHNLAYSYRLYFPDGSCVYSQDPYAKAATVNSGRSVVVNPTSAYPEGWEEDQGPEIDPSEVVIYEANIRDLTAAPSSGVRFPGKYLGLAESGTKTAQGLATGLDYLADLGISHVQLMPFFDFATVDEERESGRNYNWGYDPQNYFLPEGSYASDPFTPVTRLMETRQMIQALHQKGLGVIMDVVFNHVYDEESHPLMLTVPDYYLRFHESGHPANGSGVGSELATERRMMRRYLLDAIRYWVEEYHVDGFRFDLMGLIDVETMQAVRQLADELGPNIIILGEGWNMGHCLADQDKACLENASQLEGISFFNDRFRDALRGNDFEEGQDTGFISNKKHMEFQIVENLKGSQTLNGVDYHFHSPQQLIQYCAVHDNWTLWDKLAITRSHEVVGFRRRRQLLANTLIALTEGIPFFHSGQEFLRSKLNLRNTYNAPVEINALDWDKRDEETEAVTYLKDLLDYRKKHEVFRLTSFASIYDHLEILRADSQIIIAVYQAADRQILVAYNASKYKQLVSLPEGTWKLRASEGQFFTDEAILETYQEEVELAFLAATIFEQVTK